MPDVRRAVSDREIAECFVVMSQLRPHLDESAFVSRVRSQERSGYQLAYLADEGQVKAVAGYRFIHNLSSGHVLYVDDLVTDDGARSRGHGGTLLDWLVAQARSSGCDALELDSGVQRYGAHRFYLLHRMKISAHHFHLGLKEGPR